MLYNFNYMSSEKGKAIETVKDQWLQGEGKELSK